LTKEAYVAVTGRTVCTFLRRTVGLRVAWIQIRFKSFNGANRAELKEIQGIDVMSLKSKRSTNSV